MTATYPLLNSFDNQRAKRQNLSTSSASGSMDWDPRRPFDWRLSNWSDEVWLIRTARISGLDRILWNRRLCDGSILTDPHRADLLETAKTFFTILMQNPLNNERRLGYASVIHHTYALLTIIDWAILRGRSCLADVTPTDWEEYKLLIPYGSDVALGRAPKVEDARITGDAILAKFRVWQHLWDFHEARLPDGKRLLSDGLTFAPFANLGDAPKIAAQLGTETGRTRTIPPPTALYYLNAAIEYVANYSDDILRLRKEAARELASAMANVGAKRPTRDETTRRLAAAIKPYVLHPRETPTHDGIPSRTELAARIGVSHTPLYKNRDCIRLMDLLTAHVQANQHSHDLSVTGGALSAEIDRVFLETLPQTSGPNRAPIMANVARSIGLPFTGKEGVGAPWPIEVVGSSSKNGRSLEAATRDLWSATFLVITTFMADRLSEVLETTVDCIDTSRPDGPYMRNTTWKESDTQGGVASSRPCPAIVVRAVEVALALGEEARAATGSDKLFMSSHRGGFSVPEVSTLRQRLADFGRRIGVPPDELGDVWLVSPHELRRFFAIAWVWNYELGGNLHALQQHLRHIDVETTIRYASEAVQGEMIGTELRELTLFVMEKAAFAGLDMTGSLGGHFQRLFLKIRVMVGSPEELSRAVSRLQEKRNILLRPSAWGYCGWSPGRAKLARCAIIAGVDNATGPIEWARTSEACDGCVNFMSHAGFAPYWRDSAARHRRVLMTPDAPPILVDAAREGLKTALKHLNEENEMSAPDQCSGMKTD